MGYPGDQDDDQGPDGTDDTRHQVDTQFADLGQRREYLEDGDKDAEHHAEGGDHEDDAEDAEQPEEELVGLLGGLEHGLHGAVAHLEGHHLLAVLVPEGFEGIAVHLADDGGLAAVGLHEGHADVTDGRGAGVLTVVNDVVVHEGVDPVREGSGKAHGRGGRNGTYHRRRKDIGAEAHLGGLDLIVFHGRTDIVAALVIRILEALGADRGADPFLAVGIGRGGLLAAADLVLGLGLGMLHPLIILDIALQTDGIHGHAVIGIRQDFVGLRHSRGMDQLAVQGGIQGGDVNDVHALGLSRFDHSGRLDRIAFVPPQEDGRSDEEYKPGDNSLQGVTKPGAVACLSYFLVGHTLLI